MPRNPDVVMVRRGDPARDSLSPVTVYGLSAWTLLKDALAERGMSFRSSSPTELKRYAHEGSILLSDFGSVARLPGRARRARGIISWSLESPLVAHRAYHRIDQIIEQSDATLAFSGTREIATNDDAIRTINYPITPRTPITDDWERRDFVAMIASSKHLGLSWRVLEPARPYKTLRVVAANSLARSYTVRNTWTVPDLYEERLEVIAAFAGDPGFRLFGRGWDGARRLHPDVIRSSYGGPVADKHEVLSGFRFSLCFENTRFPGYVTEKIFDCFFAGTIPVYLGAPDVATLIPADSFIHVPEFGSFEELRAHLRGVSADDAAGYLESARRFLASDAFDPFHEETFVNAIVDEVQRLR